MGSAILSDDGRYRYELERVVPDREPFESKYDTLAVFGVNPSTADASLEDPTTRRIAGFARLLGFQRYLLGNKFAYRSTDVKALASISVEDAIGPENDEHIRRIMHCSHTVLFAWGPLAKLPPRLRNRWKEMVRMADEAGKVPMCLGVAADGHPRHPLMLPYSAPLVPWPVPWIPNRKPMQVEADILAPWEEDFKTVDEALENHHIPAAVADEMHAPLSPRDDKHNAKGEPLFASEEEESAWTNPCRS